MKGGLAIVSVLAQSLRLINTLEIELGFSHTIPFDIPDKKATGGWDLAIW